ncbi:hypothetical protein AVEN_129250-1 [Araneus ventricosus]|uniref:Uncharacterized protein n=1 Tax=Araneus ventricosus TaxID=182803 RepID=A0A4Y2RBL8_ARAVE|nr:hypothetical protein AVEN_129250-1 [Araneus ventricosus]
MYRGGEDRCHFKGDAGNKHVFIHTSNRSHAFGPGADILISKTQSKTETSEGWDTSNHIQNKTDVIIHRRNAIYSAKHFPQHVRIMVDRLGGRLELG